MAATAVNTMHAIERRTIYLVREFLLAVEVLFSEADSDPLQDSPTREVSISPGLRDYERFATQWATLVPDDATERAHIFHTLVERFHPHVDDIPTIHTALQLDTQAVQDAFLNLTGKPIAAAYSDSATGESEVEQIHRTALDYLTPEVQLDIEREMSWHYISRGDMLFDAGDPGDSLYVIANGLMRIERMTATGDAQLIARRGAGTIIGEMAVITYDKRTARVVAGRDSEVIRFTQEGFIALSERYPVVMSRMAHIIISRFRDTIDNRRERRKIRTVALVPLHEPMPDFVSDLETALRGYGSVLHLSRENLDEEVFEGALARLEHPELERGLTTWLNEAEARYRYIIYEADNTVTPWTIRALLQADHVLLVGRGADDPSMTPVEAAFEQVGRAALPRELIVVYPDGTKTASNTAAWLDARTVDDHYNIRHNEADVARLARRISGRMIGVVLGGGAMRAYAHGGVIRAIQEQGLAVDYAGGTSAGAVVSALMAMEQSLDEMVRNAERGLTDTLDYTLPFIALTSGKKLTTTLQSVFGDLCIEDLFIKFFCVSTNASTAQQVIHDRGLLWRALRASSSLPGVFPPVVADNENGDLLVDGSVLNIVPTDVMAERCNGAVIGVDISAPKISKRRYNHGDYVSGISILLNRLNPFRKRRIKGPSMAKFLSRLTIISSYKERDVRLRAADIMIVPDVSQYALFDTDQSADMMEAGYQAARAVLDNNRFRLDMRQTQEETILE